MLLFFTLSHRYNAVRGHKKCSSKIRKTFRKSEYWVGKHDGFHAIARETKANKRLMFSPKQVIRGHFCAKNRYILKRSTNHTPGALRLASVTSYLFLGWKGQVHLVLSTLSSFELFLANFELNQRPYISAPTRIIRRLIVWTDIRLHVQYEVSFHFTHVGCCCLPKWYG